MDPKATVIKNYLEGNIEGAQVDYNLDNQAADPALRHHFLIGYPDHSDHRGFLLYVSEDTFAAINSTSVSDILYAELLDKIRKQKQEANNQNVVLI